MASSIKKDKKVNVRSDARSVEERKGIVTADKGPQAQTIAEKGPARRETTRQDMLDALAAHREDFLARMQAKREPKASPDVLTLMTRKGIEPEMPVTRSDPYNNGLGRLAQETAARMQAARTAAAPTQNILRAANPLAAAAQNMLPSLQRDVERAQAALSSAREADTTYSQAYNRLMSEAMQAGLDSKSRSPLEVEAEKSAAAAKKKEFEGLLPIQPQGQGVQQYEPPQSQIDLGMPEAFNRLATGGVNINGIIQGINDRYSKPQEVPTASAYENWLEWQMSLGRKEENPTVQLPGITVGELDLQGPVIPDDEEKKRRLIEQTNGMYGVFEQPDQSMESAEAPRAWKPTLPGLAWQAAQWEAKEAEQATEQVAAETIPPTEEPEETNDELDEQARAYIKAIADHDYSVIQNTPVEVVRRAQEIKMEEAGKTSSAEGRDRSKRPVSRTPRQIETIRRTGDILSAMQRRGIEPEFVEPSTRQPAQTLDEMANREREDAESALASAVTGIREQLREAVEPQYNAWQEAAQRAEEAAERLEQLQQGAASGSAVFDAEGRPVQGMDIAGAIEQARTEYEKARQEAADLAAAYRKAMADAERNLDPDTKIEQAQAAYDMALMRLTGLVRGTRAYGNESGEGWMSEAIEALDPAEIGRYGDAGKSAEEILAENYLTDDQKKTIAYYRSIGHDDWADDYYKAIRQSLQQQREEDTQAAYEEFGRKYPILGSVASVPMRTLTGVAAGIENIGSMITGEYDPYTSARTGLRGTGTVRAGAKERMLESGFAQKGRDLVGKLGLPEETVDNALTFIYDTGISVLGDSTFNAMVLPGGANLGVLGLTAFSDTVDDMITNKGADVSKAMALGVIAGAAEIVTEKMRLDDLTGLIGGNSDAAGIRLIRNMLSEAGEEGTSEIINVISDCLIMGDESDYEQKVAEYMGAGMDEEAARKKAIVDIVVQVAEAGAGGALGGFMGGTVEIARGQVQSAGEQRSVNKMAEDYSEAVSGLFRGLYNRLRDSGAWARQMNEGAQEGQETRVVDAQEYKRVFDTIFEAGQEGASFEEVQEQAPELVSLLTQSGAERVWKAGQQAAAEEAQAKQEQPQQQSTVAQLAQETAGRQIAEARETTARTQETAQQARQAAQEAAEMPERPTARQTQTQAQEATESRQTAQQEQMSREERVERIRQQYMRSEYDPQQYRRTFDALYGLGGSGMSYEGAVQMARQSGLMREMDPAAAQAIWQAGRNVAIATVTPGVTKMYTRKLNWAEKRMVRLLDEVGRDYGLQIVLVDSLGGRANGMYQPGGRRIVVAADAMEGSIAQAGIHEMVHFIRSQGGQAYNILADTVVEHLRASSDVGYDLEEAIKERQKDYAEQIRGMSEEEARDYVLEEIVAEAASSFLADEQAVRQFTRTHRGLAEKVRDFLRDFVKRINQIVDRYAAASKHSESLAMISRGTDALVQLADFFDTALKVASEDAQAREAAGEQQLGEMRISEQEMQNLSIAGLDSAYMQAVEAGDEVAMRALVEEAAERAGYTIGLVYHGTNADFNEFSYEFMSQHGSMEGQGFYFTDSREMAEGYSRDDKGGHVLEGYLQMDKTLSDSKKTLTGVKVKQLLRQVDPTGDEVLSNYDSSGAGYPSKAWYDRVLNEAVGMIMENCDSDSEILAEIANSGAGVEAVVRAARGMGYDGYIVSDKYEGATVYVAFESNQFKRGDLITRDDQGNVIPLSERFDMGKEDIRYSKNGKEDEEIAHIKDQIRAHQDELNDMEPIYIGHVAPMADAQIEEIKHWALRIISREGGSIYREGIGDITITKNQLYQSLAYLHSNGEMEAIVAVPAVIRHGKVIEGHENHKEEGFPTITIAGRILLNGEPGNIGVVIRKTAGWRYRTHRILLPDGSVFTFGNERNAGPTAAGRKSTNGNLTLHISPASTESVPQSPQKVKPEIPENRRFSLSAPVERVRDLVAVHNMDQDGMETSLRQGGLLMPSFAVTKAAMGHSSFGPISLVVGAESIDPEADPRNAVYSGDAWTPTTNDAKTVKVDPRKTKYKNAIEEMGDDDLGNDVEEWFTSEAPYTPDEEIVNEAYQNPGMLALYLKAMGQSIEPIRYNMPGVSMDRWVNTYKTRKKFQAQTDEKAFGEWLRKEYGDNKLQPDTEVWATDMETMLEYMRKAGRKAVGTGQRTAKVEAASKKEYKTLDEVRRDKAYIGKVDNEEYNRRTVSFATNLRNFATDVMVHRDINNAYEAMTEAAKAYSQTGDIEDIRRAFTQRGITLTQQDVERARSILDEGAHMPTEYFEAKPERIMPFTEVKAILVPEEFPRWMETALLHQGVGRVIRYGEEGDEEARKAALNGLNGLKFSLNAASDGGDIIDESGKVKMPIDVKIDQAEVQRIAQTAFSGAKKIADNGVDFLLNQKLDEAAAAIRRDTRSKMKAADLSKAMVSLIQEYAKNGATAEAFAETTKLARDVIDQSTRLDDSVRKQYEGIRKMLRETPISLTDTQKQETANYWGSYGDFRKLMQGTVRIANGGISLDAIWAQLAQQAPEFFPMDTGEAQMPELLATFREAMKPRYVNNYGMDTDAASADLALRIQGDILAALGASKQAKQMYGMRQQYREAYRGAKDEQIKETNRQRVAAFRGLAEELRKAKATGNTDAYKHRMEQYRRLVKQEGMAELIAEANSNRIMMQEQTAKNARARERVVKKAESLLTMIAKPTKAARVPTMLQQTVLDVLNALDLSGKGGRETMAGKVFADKLTAITDYYQKVLNAQSKGESAEGMDGQMMAICERNVAALKDAVAGIIGEGKVRIADLDYKGLRYMETLLSTVQHSIDTINTLWKNGRYESVSELAGSTMDELDSRKERTVRDNTFRGAVSNFLLRDMVDPETFGEIMGTAGKTVTDSLLKGENEKFGHVQEAAEYTQRAMKDAGVKGRDIGAWRGKKSVKTFTLASGQTAKLTGSMVMSLYLTAKRPQGLQHLLGNGMRIMTTKETGNQVRTLFLTPEDITAITSTLTEEQRAMADAMQRYLATDVAKWGNDVTQRMYLFDAFTEETYWPLTSDPNVLKTQEPTADRNLTALTSPGFMKPLNEYANNPVILQDAFDVYGRHISEMASYAGLAEPISDALAMLNYKRKNADGLVTGTVKESMERALGKSGISYLTTLIQDLNGARHGERSAMDTLLRNYKTAAVMGKIRVVIQQPTSIFRASMEMNPAYLAAATFRHVPKKYKAEMLEHSKLAWWKANGNYDTGMGRSMDQMLYGDTELGAREVLEKASSFGGLLDPGRADDWAWVRMWQAVKLETKRTRPDLTVGSDAYWKHVTERFEKIMDRTQVVDTVAHRSQMMRSTNAFNKVLTSFQAEPTKGYNLLLRAILQANRDPSGENIAKVARAGMVYVLGAGMTALAKGLVDAFRYRDDDDDLWEYLTEGDFAQDYIYQILNNWIGDALPWRNMPLVGDALGVTVGNPLPEYLAKRATGQEAKFTLTPETYELPQLQGLADLLPAAMKVYNYLAEDNSKHLTPYGAVKPMLAAMSEVFGLPINGMANTVETLGRIYDPRFLASKMEYTTTGQTYEALYKAILRGDTKKAEKIRAELREGKYGVTEKTSKAIDTGLANILAEQDDRVREAYEMLQEGRARDAKELIREIAAQGFGEDTVEQAVNRYKAVQAGKAKQEYQQAMGAEDEAEASRIMQEAVAAGYATQEQADKWLPSGEDQELSATLASQQTLLAALSAGSKADAKAVIADARAAGRSDSTIAGWVRDEYKDKYLAAVQRGNTDKAKRIQQTLTDLGLTTESGANAFSDTTVMGWINEVYKPQYIALWQAGKYDEARAMGRMLQALGLTKVLKSGEVNGYRDDYLKNWQKEAGK